MRLPVLRLLVIFQVTRIVFGLHAIIFKHNREHRLLGHTDDNNNVREKIMGMPKIYTFPEQIENTWSEGEIPWEIKENSTNINTNPVVASFQPLSPHGVAFLFI